MKTQRFASLALAGALLFPSLAWSVDAASAAAQLKAAFDESLKNRADIVRRLADAELRATDPSLSESDRAAARQLADLTRKAERQVRPDGKLRGTQFAISEKAGIADQSVQDANLEVLAYDLPKSLRLQLALFPAATNPKQTLSPDEARVDFARRLVAHAATLPAAGRREALRQFIATEKAKLPRVKPMAGMENLRALIGTKFTALTEIHGDAIAGLEASEILIELEGDTAEAHARHAAMLARNGRRDEALRFLDIALAIDATNPRALEWEKKLQDAAPEIYTGVVEEPADQASLAMLPAMSLLGEEPKGRTLIAAEAAERTLARRLNAALRAPADRREAAVQQALAMHPAVKGRVGGAQRQLLSDSFAAMKTALQASDAVAAQKAVETLPLEAGGDSLYWVVRGVERIVKNDTRGALDASFVVLALEPENAWGKKMRPIFERTIARANQPPEPAAPREQRTPFYGAAYRAYQQGEFATAEAAVARELAANPANSDAILLGARLKLGRADLPGAQAEMQRVIAANGTGVAEARALLAQLLLAQRQKDEATAMLAPAIALEPNQPDVLFAQARMEIADNRKDTALEWARKAAAARRSFEEALAMMAYLMIEKGDSRYGMQVLKNGLHANPKSLLLHNQLALQCANAGDFAQARQEIAAIQALPHPNAAASASMLTTLVERKQAAGGGASSAPVTAAPPAQGKKAPPPR